MMSLQDRHLDGCLVTFSRGYIEIAEELLAVQTTNSIIANDHVKPAVALYDVRNLIHVE
jgi:hypothetical protein